jgi:hypothetical protein
MKTISQVARKTKLLKEKLKKKPLVENFGNKEQRQLDDYVGYTYDYPYFERQKILAITNGFFSWCINYTRR